MRAVWSFWTKPHAQTAQNRWQEEKFHRLAWALSVATAQQHYPDTWLFTDDAGARLLADTLGLPFAHVSTGLNALEGFDPRWWAAGKVWTYKAQTSPFLHLDADVFLWKRLTPDLESAPLVAQNPEYLNADATYYQPGELEHVIEAARSGWLPDEWRWYRASGWTQRAECCGVFGGTNIDFIRHYAAQALRMIADPDNQLAWSLLTGATDYSILFEQYLLSACIDYHRAHADSPYPDLGIRYLFATTGDAFQPERAAEVGYTHLIAGAKRNPDLLARLEARVQRDYPAFYERCLASL